MKVLIWSGELSHSSAAQMRAATVSVTSHAAGVGADQCSWHSCFLDSGDLCKGRVTSRGTLLSMPCPDGGAVMKLWATGASLPAGTALLGNTKLLTPASACDKCLSGSVADEGFWFLLDGISRLAFLAKARAKLLPKLDLACDVAFEELLEPAVLALGQLEPTPDTDLEAGVVVEAAAES